MNVPFDRGRRAAWQTVIMGGAAALAGCGRSKRDPAQDLPELGFEQARHLYGNAPERGGPISFQPEVRLVGDGARSIRAMAPDGINWLLDAGARDIERVRVGDIIAVTGRCAGRVCAMKREGDLVRVALGPATLTEIVRECKIESESPLDLGHSAPLIAPQMPGNSLKLLPTTPWRDTTADEDLAELQKLVALRGEMTSEFLARRALFRPDEHGGRFAPHRVQNLTEMPELTVTPTFGDGGVGMQAYARNELMEVYFFTRVRLGAPKLHFVIDVSPGSVNEASITLSAKAGVKIGFIARSAGGLQSNQAFGVQLLPMDWGGLIGSGIGGSFFATSLQQRFSLSTGFSAKNTSLQATGDWELSGDIAFGYKNGSFGVHGPKFGHTNRSILDTMDGVSLGANGLVIAHQMRCLVGVGAAGFKVGPYLGLNSSVGIARGSDLTRPVQPIPCKMATLALSARPGVGWQLPEYFVSAVNFFLGLVGVKQIPKSGGIPGDEVKLFNQTAWTPQTNACRLDDAPKS